MAINTTTSITIITVQYRSTTNLPEVVYNRLYSARTPAHTLNIGLVSVIKPPQGRLVQYTEEKVEEELEQNKGGIYIHETACLSLTNFVVSRNIADGNRDPYHHHYYHHHRTLS